MTKDTGNGLADSKDSRIRRQDLPVFSLDPVRVDTSSPVPAYVQVEQDIRRQILASEMLGQARLPRETELAELYGISRMTMRNALSRLEENNLVQRAHGVGTLISLRPRKLVCDLSLMKRISTQIEDQGFNAGQKITRKLVVDAAPEVASGLDIQTQAQTAFFERVIYVDDAPTALVRSWVPLAEFPQILDLDLVENSIWKTIEVHYHRQIVQTSNRIELIEVNAQEAQLLNLEEAKCTLGLTGIARDKDGVALEYSVANWGPNARVHFDTSL